MFENFIEADTINAYLLPSDDCFISSRKKPLGCELEMITGNRPADGGHLIIEEEDYNEFVSKDPESKKYIKRFDTPAPTTPIKRSFAGEYLSAAKPPNT